MLQNPRVSLVPLPCCVGFSWGHGLRVAIWGMLPSHGSESDAVIPATKIFLPRRLNHTCACLKDRAYGTASRVAVAVPSDHRTICTQRPCPGLAYAFLMVARGSALDTTDESGSPGPSV